MHELFDTLRAMLKKMPENEDVRRAVVFASWRRVAGNSVTAHAKAVDLDKKTLVVAVENRTWQRQMVSLAPQFVMKAAFVIGKGEVDFIDFRIMPEAFVDERRDRTPHGEDAVENIRSSELMNAAGRITDPELRKNFLLAAAGSIKYRDRQRNGRS